MITKQILKEENQYKGAYDVSNTIGVNLESNFNNLPVQDLNGYVNEYEQYLSEKNSSDKYRFVITINPFCTNALFNTVSEIVYKEGSNKCVVFGKDGVDTSLTPIDSTLKESLLQYQKYKKINSDNELNNDYLTRYNLIRDTSYSHSDIAPLVYHCGYDIFNNHILRQSDFKVINRMSSGSTIDDEHRKYFNTIEDYLRSYSGKEYNEKDMRLNIDKDSNVISSNINPHLYKRDTINGFSTALKNNLEESNGWFGFNNKVGMDILNYVTENVSLSLNKCMNNNKANEQIDFYPDRSLYSFIPKKNKYRKRLEQNWEYCLTYPYKNYYDNSLVKDINTGTIGLECILDTTIQGEEIIDGITIDLMDGKNIRFHTIVRNTFEVNDKLQFYFIYNNSTVEECNIPVEITSVGYNSNDTDYYFTVKYDDINVYLNNYDENNTPNIRVRKIVKGIECDYYFRKFRRFPNFKNTNVYADGNITEEEIKENCLHNFSTNFNTLAFERTIYSDNVTQVVFNDDIKLSGFKDNLGRAISDLYFTIVKTNYGHDEWYKEHKYTSKKVEFSHCFGKVSSAIDLPLGIDDYNIHTIHNVEYDENDEELENAGIKKSPLHLETDITISGDSDNSFLGDIVEFSPYDVEETVLEDIYHRFNTMQRELIDEEFENIVYDDILYDDLDIADEGGTVKITQKYYNADFKSELGDISDNPPTYINKFHANICPEGYYYKPHYKIHLREYSDNVQQGEHTKIVISEVISANTNTFIAKTSKNYYLNIGDKLIVYYNNDILSGTVLNVEGKLFNQITFVIEMPVSVTEIPLSDCKIFKPNQLKPVTAYELNDGTGRYLWRDFLTEEEIMDDSELYNSIFMNGSHYLTKNLMFYLRRQDPNGNYGLSNIQKNVPTNAQTMTVKGKHKDTDQSDYVKEEDMSCITI